MDIIFYHGSNHKVDKLSDEYIGREKAIDQEGPGIYFTTSKEDAEMYGKYIYTVKLNPKKILGKKKSTSVSKFDLIKLIKMKEDWKMNAQDWSENPEVGVRKAAESSIEYNDTDKDVFLQVWIDFYRYSGREYVKNMAKLGYDGIFVPKENGINHFVVYNPLIINIVNVEDREIEEIRRIIKETINEMVNR